MNVLLGSPHRYPGVKGGIASARIHDWLAQGLAELGHRVFYFLEKGAAEPLPEGVELVSEVVPDADVGHNVELPEKPWVRTCHVDVAGRMHEPLSRDIANDHWIFVSRTLARTYGKDRWVLNGIDPSHYLYSETKEDYVLFIAQLGWGLRKGVDIAVALAARTGIDLVVAGGGGDEETTAKVAALCRENGARYIGDVQGTRKAELFAGARALLFPTRLNEGCPTVILEALASGTPVIASDRGACPELVSEDVGFVCGDEDDYVRALERVGSITPRACRERVLRDFHYLRMTRDYLREYEREMGRV